MNALHRVINSHSSILQPDTITSTNISISNSIGRVFKSQIKIPVYKELLDSITSYEETIILNQLLYYYDKSEYKKGLSIYDLKHLCLWDKSFQTLRKKLKILEAKGYIESSNHTLYGNTTIQSSMWTEVAVDKVIPDIMKFFKFTNVKPYAMDNNHLYRNNGLYPDNMVMAEWASETEYKVENIGCHLVLNTQGGEFITGNPFVWLIMMDVKDNGDDMFFGSNVKQNVFNSDSYSKPVWTLFFDRKEITHYIHKIRKINNSDVFKNLVENWLYFTVQDNGLTSIDVFNPVGPDN